MSNGFITTNDVVRSAIARGFIDPAQKDQLKEMVDALDLKVDGKLDGGFYKGQAKGNSSDMGRIIGSLFRGQTPVADRPKKPEKDTPVETGIKFLLGMLMIGMAGCDDKAYHECINPPDNCPIGPIICWYDRNNIEQCDCDYDYVEVCGRNGCSCEYDPDYYYDDYYYYDYEWSTDDEW